LGSTAAALSLAVGIDRWIGGLTGLVAACLIAAAFYIGLLYVIDRKLGLGLAQSLFRVFPQLQRRN
jgi:hypothetical protein